MVHERGAALVLHLGFDDGRRDIPVVLDPTQGSGQGAGPCQLDVRSDTAKRLCSELRGVALVGYIEDFHGSDDRDDRNVHLFYRSEVGTSAILAPAGSRDLPSRAKRTSWCVRCPFS